MESVGVREMRQNLSRYLERVRAGESFEVTDRGEPVARLLPSERYADIASRLAERHGVRPPSDPRRAFRPALPAPADAPSSDDILDELRRDRL